MSKFIDEKTVIELCKESYIKGQNDFAEILKDLIDKNIKELKKAMESVDPQEVNK